MLRSDHVTSAACVVFGICVFAMSTDLPTGAWSMPGAGLFPKLLGALIIGFGLLLLVRSGNGPRFADIDWGDLAHAIRVAAITAVAVACYETGGFILTMALMMFVLLVAAERRNVFRAALYSAGVTLLTYFLFTVALKTPLEPGLLKF
jgi:putative tricarboxylic transport membrane protein